MSGCHNCGGPRLSWELGLRGCSAKSSGSASAAAVSYRKTEQLGHFRTLGGLPNQIKVEPLSLKTYSPRKLHI
ncbi:hypothetical protein PGT21_026452 [Puccinia graminis f. sp. tritici]|uniref:Uncharacterized protein n=1 Tax=Puccinia graminis f. sp. tritici TaxID=56615 RepID=A0A5B0RYY4_PUCGR|nr:hypothetical protein PGT21_026452 [Puccinia graminis f. sp. tritici]KAA1131121.1 hypothetical protein PGTUg99_011393 [Puccinia graminis f. sp. tritici]